MTLKFVLLIHLTKLSDIHVNSFQANGYFKDFIYNIYQKKYKEQDYDVFLLVSAQKHQSYQSTQDNATENRENSAIIADKFTPKRPVRNTQVCKALNQFISVVNMIFKNKPYEF